MADFIKEHKKLLIILGVLFIVIVTAFTIRTINLSKKEEQKAIEAENKKQQEQLQAQAEEEAEAEEEESDISDYQSSLSIKAKEEKAKTEEARKRLEEKKAEKERLEQEEKAKKAAEIAKPTYGSGVKIWEKGKDTVPERMDDGSSIKKYYSSVSLSDFGSMWGSKLTQEDKLTENFYMVGVDQNPDDYVKGVQLQSFGWLIENLGSLPKNSAIKFADLHVVGSLAQDHMAILACYNWYSVWGMKETLMVFEDMSGTLSPSDFQPGDVFSAMIYAHNIKVEQVNGQTVICVQYNKF